MLCYNPRIGMDILIGLLGNTARAKILRFLFASPHECRTHHDIASHAQLSIATVRRELKMLEKLGIIHARSFAPQHKKKGTSSRAKREVGWVVNTAHDMYRVVAAFVRDTEPDAKEGVMEKLKGIGSTKLLVASGCLVEGEESPSRLDLLIVGDRINERKVSAALRAIEAQYGREVAYAVFSTTEFRYRYDIRDRLVRDILDYPHQVLLDKLRLL